MQFPEATIFEVRLVLPCQALDERIRYCSELCYKWKFSMLCRAALAVSLILHPGLQHPAHLPILEYEYIISKISGLFV